MTQVLLAHEHAPTRDNLRRILAAADDFEVAGQAADADEALALIGSVDPDLLVLGPTLPGLQGLDAFNRRHAPHTRIPVIVLARDVDMADSDRLLRMGAGGYVAFESAPTELAAALRAVHNGRHFACTRTKRALDAARAARREAKRRIRRLTRREVQVLGLLAIGRTVPETAAALGLSRKTVEAHRRLTLIKLGLRNDVELTRFAIAHGLVRL